MSRFIEQEMIHGPRATLAPVAPRHEFGLPELLLMLASTMAVGLTFDPLIVALWLAIWYCSRRFATPTKHSAVFAFLIAFSFFYPESASAYIPGLHEQVVVGAVVMIVALWLCHAGLAEAWRQSLLLRIVFVRWIGWGLLAYLPVLLGWALVNLLSLPLPLFLEGLPIETSASKSGIPVIAAIAMAIVPVATLKTTADMDRFLETVVKIIGVVVVLGLVQALLGFRLIRTGVSFNPARLRVSAPDANSYGRPCCFRCCCSFQPGHRGGRCQCVPMLAATGPASSSPSGRVVFDDTSSFDRYRLPCCGAVNAVEPRLPPASSSL